MVGIGERHASPGRAPPRRALRGELAFPHFDGWAFDLEILALARRRCYGIAEVAVEWHDDERSKVNPIKDMWKVIREAIQIRKNLRRGVYGQLVAAL